MQVCIHLPDELAGRFRAAIPAKKRSAFIVELLEKALSKEDDALYRIALEVEGDTALDAEMADWDGVIGDGLEGEGETR